jgi:hypothetical protein
VLQGTGYGKDVSARYLKLLHYLRNSAVILITTQYTVSYRGVVLTTHPPTSAEVKERVELYLYSPFGPSWPVIGKTLLFYTVSYTVTYRVKTGNKATSFFREYILHF